MGGWTTPGDEEVDESEVLDQHQVLVGQVDSYDLTSDTWELETRVPTPRFHSGAAIVKDKMYVVGGLTASARRRQTPIQGKFLADLGPLPINQFYFAYQSSQLAIESNLFI